MENRPAKHVQSSLNGITVAEVRYPGCRIMMHRVICMLYGWGSLELQQLESPSIESQVAASRITIR